MLCFVVKSDIINLRENCPADAVDGRQPSLGIDRAKNGETGHLRLKMFAAILIKWRVLLCLFSVFL